MVVATAAGKKTAVVVAGRAVALWEPDLLGS